MIRVTDEFYGSQVTIEGTYEKILKDLESISRTLIYQGFDKDDLIDAVIEGFFENPEVTPLDGKKVTNNDIKRVTEEMIDEPIEEHIKKLKELEESKK